MSRTELLGSGKSGGVATIFDAAGNVRLSLYEDPKTAYVAALANTVASKVPGTGRREWLQALKKLGRQPDRELGQKLLDGKRVKGFAARQGTYSFTMWVDIATGQPAHGDYETPVDGAVLPRDDDRFSLQRRAGRVAV